LAGADPSIDHRAMEVRLLLLEEETAHSRIKLRSQMFVPWKLGCSLSLRPERRQTVGKLSSLLDPPGRTPSWSCPTLHPPRQPPSSCSCPVRLGVVGAPEVAFKEFVLELTVSALSDDGATGLSHHIHITLHTRRPRSLCLPSLTTRNSRTRGPRGT
jgi:hypothetical protein